MKHVLSCGVLLAGALLVAPALADNIYIGHGGHGAAHAPAATAGRGASSGQHFGHGGNFAGGRNRGGNGWVAGAAGLAAGAVVGGAIAANNGYYGGPGYYAGGPAYADGYYDDGPGYDAPNYAYGAPPQPGYADESNDGSVAYCEQTFKSYDPASGTYLGYDGQRHSCP